MKVLSLLQPWATLVVIGVKKIETRSWNTKYRGPLLIHASAGFKKEHKQLCETEHFKDFILNWEDLPLGEIIGSVALIDTTRFDIFSDLCCGLQKNGHIWEFTEQEKAFGDYTAGRYGWLFDKPKQFTNPIPAKGSLSLWDYTIADNQY